MILEALSAVRDIGRLHDIASILIRYGFGDIVRRLGLVRLVERAGRALNWKYVQENPVLEAPERVRRAMEDMGPTFIKLGQILASRVDLFAPEWIEEFEKLQDQVQPLPFEMLQAQWEKDIKQPLDEVFRYLEKTPMATASIAQVHRAELVDGSQVVVKFRRPKIGKTIAADLRLLDRLARIAEREILEIRRYRPREIIHQFENSLRRELDLAMECRNAERMTSYFKDDPNIVIPKMYWAWVSERINVQEYIEGIHGRDFELLETHGYNRKVLSTNGAEAFLKMVLIAGMFHADPHPGNIIYLAGNRIAFLDFGMVGRLSKFRRNQVVDLLHAMVEHDANAVVDVLLDWAGDRIIDTEALTTEVDSLIDSYHGVPLKRLNISDMLSDLAALLRDYSLSLPADLTMLFKALITLEGMARQLNPDFDLVSEATPFLRQITIDRYKPDVVLKRGRKNVIELFDILSGLPRDFRRLIKAIRSGALRINVDLAQLDNFGRQVDNAASRLTVGMITAALIIGSSIVMTVGGGPTIMGLPALGFLGFSGAGLSGIWILISIWRGAHNKNL